MLIPVDLKEFVQESYNLLIDDLNTTLTGLSFSSNFGSDILTDIEIAAGETARFTHKLGVVPVHRLITRQIAGGLITDGVFTKNYIELINTGASRVRLTVILIKE